LKRASSQKSNQSVLLPTALFPAELGDLKQVSPDSNRRVYTSAAMIGLAAISMGFPNLLFPEGQQAARAAEPAALDPNQTTAPALQPNFTGRSISTTVASPGFNVAPASLGNAPVGLGNQGVSRAETLSPESEVAIPQPSQTTEGPDQGSNPTPVTLTPGSIQASTNNLPVVQQQKEREQAALDEAVRYLTVLESVNPESPRPLTVLPSGKTAPKFQSVPVDKSPVGSDSVMPPTTEAKLEDVGAVKPSWQEMQRQAEEEVAGESESIFKATPIPQVPVSEGEVTPTTATLPASLPKKVTLEFYQVQSGDTVDTIAQTHGVDSKALIQANQLNNPDELEVDQSLAVPRLETPNSGMVSSLTWQAAGGLQTLQEFDGQPRLFTQSPESSAPSAPSAMETLPTQSLTPKLETNPSLETTQPMLEAAPKRSEFSAQTSAQTKDQLKEIAPMKGASTQVEEGLPNLPVTPSLVSTPIASRFDPINSQFPQPILHQVRRGETLDAIARRYGVTRSELIQLNQITNPNLIQVNQSLKIPKAQNPALSPVPSLVSGANSTQISSTVVDTHQPVPLVNFNGGSSSEKQASQLSSRQSTYSSYVEGLTTEINQLREQFQNQPASVTFPRNPLPTPVDNQVNQPVAPVTPSVDRVNPEFSPSSSTGNLEADLRRLQEKYRSSNSSAPTNSRTPAPGEAQNVAVAPLGPDAYDPSRLPIGEMVSPEVPPLAPSERYLPGSDRMNGFIWPAQGVFTSGYGWRWGRMHRGIDIAGPIGTPIFAAAPGVVDYAGWNSGGYGNLVDIRHPDGSLTRYAHNNRLLVRKGQRVRQGQQIAEMGSTGYSTGPHLHFEIHPAGQGAVNPMAYLPNR